MIRQVTILLAFLMTLSSPVAAQDFNKGLVAHNLENYAPVTLPKVKSPYPLQPFIERRLR